MLALSRKETSVGSSSAHQLGGGIREQDLSPCAVDMTRCTRVNVRYRRIPGAFFNYSGLR